MSTYFLSSQNVWSGPHWNFPISLMVIWPWVNVHLHIIQWFMYRASQWLQWKTGCVKHVSRTQFFCRRVKYSAVPLPGFQCAEERATLRRTHKTHKYGAKEGEKRVSTGWRFSEVSDVHAESWRRKCEPGQWAIEQEGKNSDCVSRKLQRKEGNDLFQWP